MKFSYNWLQSFFSKKLPEPEKLAELLTLRSFEIEEVLKKGDDYILDIDILPNRAHDCLSHFGVARECSALLSFKLQIPNPKQAPNPKSQTKNILKVDIQDNELCSRYTAYVMDNVQITESPGWMKDRLAAMGQKAINNIVDITNYVMWELGQPLHAFDFAKIQGAKMNIRLSYQGEKLETLDGATYDLADTTIIIEDGGRIIDLAGIKGGANTQIDKETDTVIFQAAIFDPSRIRKSTQTLGIKTDAAVRYIHGFDPNLPSIALDRALELLQITNPEARVVEKIDICHTSAEPHKISLDVQYANKLLGTYLSIREMTQILERLGFAAKKSRFQVLSFKFQVIAPTYRLDINIPEDLIEEIGRIYGYENIKPDPARGILILPRRNEQVFWRNMARVILSGFGFSEVYNYSLIPNAPPFGRSLSLRDISRRETGRQSPIHNVGLLELANPVSEEFRYLRPLLLHGVLKNVATNLKNFSDIQIFEIGKVFDAKERENCILALSAPKNAYDAEGFYKLKGHATELFQNFGITDFYLDPALSPDEEERFKFLHPGKRANILLNNEKVGYIGEMNPTILDAYDINETRVYCAEFDFEMLQAAAEEEHIYQKPSKYPEVARDIALLTSSGTMVEEVENVINGVSGPLLRDVDLFDIYEGENIPEGMKNFAFHLLFQSDDRTLTSHEVDAIMSKITKALEEKLWEVR